MVFYESCFMIKKREDRVRWPYEFCIRDDKTRR